MDNLTKIRMLIPHWVEHNQEHGAEFLSWADKIAAEAPDAAAQIRQAAGQMDELNATLNAVAEQLGGPLEMEHSH